jgi:CDP-paratose 2-epimerase
LLELIALLEEILERRIPVQFADWRPGDQRVFVSNIDKVSQRLGWAPGVGCKEGVQRLVSWVVANREELEKYIGDRPATSPVAHGAASVPARTYTA